MKDKIISFFKSYNAICAALVLIIIALMIANVSISNKSELYIFNGYNEELTILDGSIYIGRKINHFSAPNIIFNDKSLKFKTFKIGYYIGDKEISVITNDDYGDVKSFNIANILNSTEFSFTEKSQSAYYFSSSNIKNINKLAFKIEGITEENEKISQNVALNVTKIN